MELVENPACGRCKQAFQMVLGVFCDSEATVALRFGHLGQHCRKPGYFDDISVSREEVWGC
jgi:hypothetical protein